MKKVHRKGRVQVVVRAKTGWFPSGGLTAPNGDLWILEYSALNAVRVRRIAKDGIEKTYG